MIVQNFVSILPIFFLKDRDYRNIFAFLFDNFKQKYPEITTIDLYDIFKLYPLYVQLLSGAP
jgi:hypothetical protein